MDEQQQTETPAAAPVAPQPVATTPAPEAPREDKSTKARIAELEAQLEQFKATATKAEQLAQQLEDMKLERAAWQAGVTDPEGIEVARLFHGKLPAKDRPSLGDWLGQLKADPSTAPRALAAYLAPVTPAAAPAPTGKPLPSANAGALPTPAASGQFDASAIRAMRQEAQRTGDYSKLREAMPAIRESMKR